MRIEMVEYDAGWPELYRREEARIRAALGDRALRIEHTGSTAVPGLAAKPVIDVTLVVANAAEEQAYRPALEAAGYLLRMREPRWHEHRLFNRQDAEVNLHVFSSGCLEVERILIFRDRLRNDTGDRELYARAKQELARKEWNSVDEYAKSKSAVVKEILRRARAAQR